MDERKWSTSMDRKPYLFWPFPFGYPTGQSKSAPAPQTSVWTQPTSTESLWRAKRIRGKLVFLSLCPLPCCLGVFPLLVCMTRNSRTQDGLSKYKRGLSFPHAYTNTQHTYPGSRQQSVWASQRGCCTLQTSTPQLKAWLCWSAKAFLNIPWLAAGLSLGGRPPS